MRLSLNGVLRSAALAMVLLTLGLAVQAADPAPTTVTSLTLFAGNQAGLWRSTDWGGTWKLVTRRPLDELGAAYSIVALGARVYLGGSQGLFTSEDFGENWQRLATVTDVRAVLSSRYPEADPTMFIGTSAGLLKSTDAGKTFAPTSVTGAIQRLEWPGPALVACGQGLFVSENGAVTVRGTSEGLPAGPVSSLALSSFFDVDPVLFVGASEGGVFRSTDGGRHFAASGLSGVIVNDLVWLGPLLYAATDAGLYRSDDSGRRWEKIGEGLSGRRVRRLLFPLAPDSGSQVFAATDAGIYRSADGGQRFERSGLSDQSVDVLATFPAPQPLNRKR